MKTLKQLSLNKFLIITFFAIILSCIIYFFSVRFFEKSAYDFMSKLSANKAGSDSIINVVIDENSIKEVASWPWKRTYYADIFDFLNKSGAKIIAFDAILTTNNINDDDKIFLDRISKINNLVAGVEFTKNENTQNSKQELNNFAQKFSLKVTDNRNSKFIEDTSYLAYNQMLVNYIDNLKSIGAVNTALDTDGIVRGFEPIVSLDGRYYPSLPLAVYLKLNKVKEIVLYDNEYELIFDNGENAHIPVVFNNGKYVQYIKWLAPFSKNSWVAHEQVKASDIIKSYENIKNGKAPIIEQSKFKDKIVVIGATANALYDLKLTPVSINMPGSTIQATIIDNLLSNDNITIASAITNIILMLIFMIIAGILALSLLPAISLVCIMILCFLYFYVAMFLYSKGYAINIITPYIFLILTTIWVYSYKFTIEDSKKEKLQNAMKKYVNTSVVDNIMKNSDAEIKLGGKKTELTILMADIRGFTHFSENLDPDEVTKLLNEYFGQMIPIIEEYGGCVNKFIGDAILAVFNEPIKDKKHPINAILCANKMLETVRSLKKKWKSEGKPDIGISIGINTGTAFIGNIGTPNHLEYTVIGDTVNVASRIEAQNRQFNTQILISETTYEYAKDMLDVIKISSVEIRGREKHMDIYEIINILNTNETDR